MKGYPRLAVRRAVHHVPARLGHLRGFVPRTLWTVYWVDSPEATPVHMMVGGEDSVVGWAECMDFAHSTVRLARSQRGDTQ